MMKERGEEEEDEEGDETRDGCDNVGGEELCLTEVVLVVRGRRIRVDRYMLSSVSQSTLESLPIWVNPTFLKSFKLP